MLGLKKYFAEQLTVKWVYRLKLRQMSLDNCNLQRYLLKNQLRGKMTISYKERNAEQCYILYL